MLKDEIKKNQLKKKNTKRPELSRVNPLNP
jgi:hypothetical protein